MKPSGRWLLIAGMALAAGGAASPVPRPAPWRSFSIREGLPGRFSLFYLLEDQRGRMWLGGRGGIVVWDGHVWKPVRANPESMTFRSVAGLVETPDQQLWIASGRGLDRYDQRLERWSRLATPQRPTGIVTDRDGQLWMATRAHGLLAFEPQRERWHTYTVREGLAGDDVREVLAARDGSLWVAYVRTEGVSRRDPAGHWQHFTRKNSGFASEIAGSLFQTRDDRIWAPDGERGQLLNVYDPKLSSWQPVHLTASNRFPVRSGRIDNLVEGLDGTLYFRVWGQGIVMFDPRTMRAMDLLTPQNSGLKSDTITGMTLRRDGSLWVGHFNGDLSVFDPGHLYLSLLPPTSGQESPVVSVNHEGTVCRVEQDLLMLYRPAGSGWQRVAQLSAPVGYGRMRVVTMLRSGDFACATERGIFHQRKGTDRWLLSKELPTAAHVVTAIIEGLDDTLWLPMPGVRKIGSYDLGRSAFTEISWPLEESTARPELMHSGLHCATDKKLWLATYGAGVWCYDPRTKDWQHYSRNRRHLIDNAVNALADLGDGKLAFGTDHGVSYYEAGRWRSIDEMTANFEMISHHVNSLGKTPDGKLWFGTGSGVALFDGENWGALTAGDGLPQEYCSPRGMWPAPDGSLLLRMGRFVARVRAPELAPETIVRWRQLFRRRTATGHVHYEGVTSPRTATVREATLLRQRVRERQGLPPLAFQRSGTVSLELLGSNPFRQDLQEEFWFSHRIDGGPWSRFVRGPVLTLRNLSTGTHRIEVRAKNRWLNVDPTPARFELRVELPSPRWMLNLMAGALLTLAAGLAVGTMLYRQRLRHIAELNAANLRVAQALGAVATTERLATLGQMTAGIAHEIGNPLASVLMWAQSIADRAAGNEPIREAAHIIQREASRLSNLLDEIRHHAHPQPYALQPASLADLAREVCAFMRADQMIQEYAIEIVELVEGESIASLHVDKMKQVLINLIRNAAQAIGARPGGRILVSTREADRQSILSVTDNGRGIPSSQLDQIWGAFFTTKGPEGTGLGLSITRQIVERHGGTIEVVSREGEGATFTVRLPKP